MALRAANGLLDGVTALLVLLAVVWSGYALWDNSRVYAAADNVQAGLLAFKPQPQEDNSLSFGQLRDITPDVCGWLTLAGAASAGVESEARSAALSAKEVIRFIKLFLLVRYSESTFCLVPVYSFLPLRRAV